MEDKILSSKFEIMCAKRTRSRHGDRSDQDDAVIQHDKLSTQEWSNCEKCQKMTTGLECVLPQNFDFI